MAEVEPANIGPGGISGSTSWAGVSGSWGALAGARVSQSSGAIWDRGRGVRVVQVTFSLGAKWTTEEVPRGEEEIEYSVVRSRGQVIELTHIQQWSS